MKALIFLGLLGSIGAAVLAVMTRVQFKETRVEKDTLNRETYALHETITKQIGEINAVDEVFVSTSKNAKNEELQTKSLASETKGKEEELESAKKDTLEIAAKKQAMEEEITRILGSTGTPEELAAKTEALKKENDSKVEELDKVGKEAEVAKSAAADSQKMVTLLKQQQATRDKGIALASRTATISAVNPDYGFVIVNLGQNQGVNSESRLLVKRGTQLIGKLSIVQISGNTTVADIVSKSITPGFSIEPGDQVIFENSPT